MVKRIPDRIPDVASEPDSAEQVAACHEWYDSTHSAEMLGIDGLVSARVR